MYEDKTLVCKECGAEFVFTSLRDAKPAATPARPAKKRTERCSPLFAQAAAKRQRFLSSQEKTALFIAASALLG